MNTPKKHHFVPQMLLRRFCDSSGRLWYYNKNVPHLGVASGEPKTLFYRKNFYSTEIDGARDISLENYFAQLEGKANQVIEKICVSARAGTNPSLTAAEKKAFNLFLYYQWKRTPESISAKTSNADFENQLEEFLAEFERRFRPLSGLERQRILSENGKKPLRQNAWVRAVGDPSAEVQSTLNNMGICVGIIRKPNKSFIIGSKSVIKLTPPGETRLGQPGVEVWLPIASDIAICPIPEKGQEILIPLSDDRWLRSFNEAILQESSLIAGRSQLLIRSLVFAR